MKTINIKGKSYVQVNERVKAFRSAAEYKGFAIHTIVKELTDDVCVMCAQIIDTQNNIVATGWAREVRNDATSMVNKTSYVENCETSAVGRALGFLGIGIDENICSAEELQFALQAQEDEPQPKPQPKAKAAAPKPQPKAKAAAPKVPTATIQTAPPAKTKDQENFDALLSDIECAETMEQLKATMLLAKASPYYEALRNAANSKAQQRGWA